MAETHKTCATCGFLSKVRLGSPSQTDAEPVDQNERDSGHIGKADPYCFLAKARLLDEAIFAADDPSVFNIDPDLPISYWYAPSPIRDGAVHAVINKDRTDTCDDSWYSWNKSLTPRQHYEERRMFQLEEERRKWQDRLFQLEQQLENDREVHRHSSDRFNLRLTLILGIFAVLQTFGQLGNWWYPNGHPWFTPRSSSIPTITASPSVTYTPVAPTAASASSP